jgi:hypothetical protein
MDRIRRSAVALGVLALLAAAPAAARADSIVFQRGGDIWLMQPDGGGARAVTHGEHAYEWPSEADDGTIVAGDGAGAIDRLTQGGAPIGAPLPTAATFATEDSPAESPTHVRISPDGQRIAYDQVIDDGETTLWTPAAATGLDFPNQVEGQEGFDSPSWLGDGNLLLSQEVAPLGQDLQTFALYHPGDGDDSGAGWFSDDAGAAWATGYDAAVARSGTRVAVVEDDAAEYVGTPHKVAIRLFTAAAPGAPVTFACELPVQADDSYQQASPSFSPDGTRLAWSESDGIHVANLGALSGCGGIVERLVGRPGDDEPYWSAAGDATPPPAPPDAGKPATLKLKVTAPAHLSRVALLEHGLKITVACDATCALRLTLRLDATTAKRLGVNPVVGLAHRRLAKPGSVTVRVKLRSRTALARLSRIGLRLRVSAPGAAAVSRAVRAG